MEKENFVNKSYQLNLVWSDQASYGGEFLNN